MHLENLLTADDVRQLDVNLAVEATCTKQGLVENVGTVGGGQHDDARVGAEAVHLSKQLVQSAFTFVVAACDGTLATGTTDGVDLIDEDDARGFLLGVVEQVADARGTHADKHLHEVGTRQAEERHIGLACHTLCEQGLTRSGRAYQQHALRDLAAQFGVFLRILQEVDDLHDFHFGLFQTRHIFESDVDAGILVIELGARLADVENRACAASATHAATHAAHDDDPNHNQYDERQPSNQKVGDPALAFHIVDIHWLFDLFLLLHILHHLFETAEVADAEGIARRRSGALSVGSHLREILRQAFLIEIHLSFLVVDQVDALYLLLLQQFDKLTLIDILLWCT